MIPHEKSHEEENNAINPDRFALRERAVERMEEDGLDDLKYELIETEKFILFEIFKVKI